MPRIPTNGRWLLLAAVGVVCAVVGWTLGNWSACIESNCSFDAELFGAVGTWIGGLATALAVGVAAHQLSIQLKQDREQRDAAQVDLRKAATEAVSAATDVRVELQPYIRSGVGVTEVRVAIHNETEEPLGNVHVRLADLDEASGSTIAPQYEWEFTWDIADLERVGSVSIPRGRNVSDLALDHFKDDIAGLLEVRFEVRGHRLRGGVNMMPRLADEARGF